MQIDTNMQGEGFGEILKAPMHKCRNRTLREFELFFFCWRLLGLVPGGAPFSQLSSGVRDAMVVSTKLVKCHFVTKTCITAD